MPALETVAPDTPIEELHRIFERDGALIVGEAMSPALLDQVLDEVMPYVEATAPGRDAFTGYRTTRTGALVARSPGCRTLVMDPLVRAMCDGVLLPNCERYQLHLTQVIEIGPGEPAQIVHRDQWAFDFFSFPSGFEVECHTMWAMHDFTEENGATRVIPGSNHWEDKLRCTPDQTIAAEMPKGSVLLYLGSLYHGGGANNSSQPRRGINVGYTLSWLRQEENQYLACPPEVARELPEALARLAGYQRGAYALGYYGDLHDPIDALHGPSNAAPSFAPQQ